MICDTGGTWGPHSAPTPRPRILQAITWTGSGSWTAGGSHHSFRATPCTASPEGSRRGVGLAQRTNTTSVADDGSGDPATRPARTGDRHRDPRIDRVDLAIDKSHAEAPVAGDKFSWSIVVSNLTGFDTAVGPFVVTDTLPQLTAGVTYGPPSARGGPVPAG